jgi:hypothetical protein
MRALTLEASMITGIPLAGTESALTPDTIAAHVVKALDDRARKHPNGKARH